MMLYAIFSPCLLWPLGMEVGLGPECIVLDATAPQFSVHVCCGQTAGWIKMPLGTMVGLGPGNIVIII